MAAAIIALPSKRADSPRNSTALGSTLPSAIITPSLLYYYSFL
jgi:hypothetical protein